MVVTVVLAVTAAGLAATDDPGPPDKGGEGAAAKDTGTTRTSLGKFIRAGGIVGYTIIALSSVGLALVVDTFLHVRPQRLVPEAMTEQVVHLARQGKLNDMMYLCKSVDCLLGRIVSQTFSQGRMSWAVARDVMQELGTREVTRLYQRVGYIGFIASVAPMLGLLGTVTGMIDSFGVLGTAKGAADADELATGVSEALVTTCMGLIVALPLMFFHSYFRDRVTQIGQEAASVCDRLIRAMTEWQLSQGQPSGGEEEAPEGPQDAR